MKKKVTIILLDCEAQSDSRIEQEFKSILENDLDYLVSYVEIEDIPEGEE